MVRSASEAARNEMRASALCRVASGTCGRTGVSYVWRGWFSAPLRQGGDERAVIIGTRVELPLMTLNRGDRAVAAVEIAGCAQRQQHQQDIADHFGSKLLKESPCFDRRCGCDESRSHTSITCRQTPLRTTTRSALPSWFRSWRAPASPSEAPASAPRGHAHAGNRRDPWPRRSCTQRRSHPFPE